MKPNIRKIKSAGVYLLAMMLTTACAAAEQAPTATVNIAPTSIQTPVPTATAITVSTETPTSKPTATSKPYPSARGYHNLCYDSESGVVILISGLTSGNINNLKASGDIWAFDTNQNTWSPIDIFPSEHTACAYSAVSDKMIIYSDLRVKPRELVPTGKIKTFDFNNNTLGSISSEDVPRGYVGAQLAYDSESDQVIFFGGLDLATDELFGETYTYNLNTNTWTKMNPRISPPERNYQNMVYHPTIDRVIMFSGYVMGDIRDNETWSYDVDSNTWTNLVVTNAPPGREYSAMVYVNSLNRIILFGGSGLDGTLNDMWAFDHQENTWAELKPDVIPGKRAWHAMVYDSEADKIVLFGGGDSRDTYTNETWIYDPQTNIWTNLTPDN